MPGEPSTAGSWPPELGPGIYVHVPLCRARCGYCDFYAETAVESWRDRLAAGLQREIELAASAGPWGSTQFRSVYFGGGTPSLLGGPAMEALLGALRRHFTIAPEAEITAEANPESLSPEVQAAWREAGIGRVSLGVQSMQDTELRLLGRLHDVALVHRRVAELRAAGFSRLGLDLIYGLPGSSLRSWRQTLDAALALEPEHVSAYLLTLEGDVPMERAVAAGNLRLPDDDELRRQYELLCVRAEAAGLRQYEISNFARPGEESRHNENYWVCGDYLGLGPAAHSHRAGRRWANPRSLPTWFDAVSAGHSPAETLEEPSPAARFEEWIFLGLRRTEGVPWTALQSAASPLAWSRFRERATRLIAAGLLEETTERLRLAPAARFVSNGVFSDLLAAIA